MDRRDKLTIGMQIPIFIIGIIFIGLGLRQEYFWLKYFDIAFGVFNMVFSTSITVSNVRDIIRGRYHWEE